MSIVEDVETFATGWTKCRGESNGVRRQGDVLVATFPRFGLVEGRTHEILGCAEQVSAILEVARFEEARGTVWIAVFADRLNELFSFEHAGFEVFRRDWLMILEKWPGSTAMDDVILLKATDLDDLPDKKCESIRTEFFDEPSFRLAAIRNDSRISAWGRSASGSKATIVIDSMMTDPSFRRRGLGRRVVTTLLNEGSKVGHSRSILIATDDGRALYETLGYRVVRSCFCLRRRIDVMPSSALRMSATS